MNSSQPDRVTTIGENPASRKHLIMLLMTVCIGILYIYHNPAPWMALKVNFYAFFLVAKPYTYYSHLTEFICITILFLEGHLIGNIIFNYILSQKKCQNPAITIPTGWGVLAFLIFAMALLQCLNPLVIGICLGLVLVICLPLAWRMGAFRWELSDKKKWLVSLPLDSRLALLLIFIPLFFAFFCSLMPPTQSDGLRYHISVPKLYLQHGGFYLIPDIAFSNFPFLIEYIYTIPLAFDLHSVPKMIHASYYLFTICLIYSLGRKIANSRCGIFAALLFASVPFTSIFASWSFIEMGLTFYTLLTFYLCVEAVESSRQENGISAWRLVVLAGISGGFLLSCKYTALATIFLYSLMLSWPRKQWSLGHTLSCIRQSILFGLIVAAVASPWFIKNLILLGNPVYPFAGGIFPTPYWTEFNNLFFRFHAGLKGRFIEMANAPAIDWLIDAVTLPFRATFFPGDQKWHAPENFGSWQLGPLWLMLAPFLLLYRQWTMRKWFHLTACLFLYFVWAYTYRDSRFLLPAMAVAAPLFAALLEDLIQIRSWIRWCFFVPVFYNLLFTAAVSLLPTTSAPWWVVSGTITEEDYLENVCDFTRNPNQAFHWLKENTQPNETVLIHGIEHPFYYPNDFIGADWFNTDPLIAWSWELPDAEQLADRLREKNVRYVVYYYGKLKSNGHILFYRLFRLPPEKSVPLLKELSGKEYTKNHYPLAWNEWNYRFQDKLRKAENESPNIKALEQLLDGNMMKEVFRYVYNRRDENGNIIPPEGIEDGIVIYKVPYPNEPASPVLTEKQ